jgi:hypothetical protein
MPDPLDASDSADEHAECPEKDGAAEDAEQNPPVAYGCP